MLKKLCLALVVFALAFSAEAQELTPRQMLLLQVPENHVLSLTIADTTQNPLKVEGIVRWSILQSEYVPGGPFELLQFFLVNKIETYLVVGTQLEEVIWKGYGGEDDYLLAGKFHNNILEIIFSAAEQKVSETDKIKVSENMVKWIAMVLTKLEILTDEDLAQHIRRHIKKATPL